MIAVHHAQVVASPEVEVQDPAAASLAAAEAQDPAVDVHASDKKTNYSSIHNPVCYCLLQTIF